MLLPVIDAGIIQNPMFGGGTPPGWAVLFPTYGPMRVVVDASLAPQQHLGSDLLISGLRRCSVRRDQHVALVTRRAGT